MQTSQGTTLNLKSIAEDSFWILLLVYAVLIVVIALGFISRYTLHFNILALMIAILGISIISKKQSKSANQHMNKIDVN